MKNFKNDFPKDWRQSSDLILQAASILERIHKDLPRNEYKIELSNLGLNERISRSLIKISSNARLYDKRIKDKLPDSWSTISILASLEKSNFELLVKEKLLNKKITRKDIADFKLGINKVVISSKKDNKKHRLITIRFDQDFLDAQFLIKVKEEIKKTIDSLMLVPNPEKTVSIKKSFRDSFKHEKLILEKIEAELQSQPLQIEEHLSNEEILNLSKRLEHKMKNQKYPNMNEDFALKWANRICRSVRLQQKRKASIEERRRVKLNFTTKGWGMEETQCITDIRGIEVAFGELGLDHIDIDKLKTDPTYGKEQYNQLKMTYNKKK